MRQWTELNGLRRVGYREGNEVSNNREELEIESSYRGEDKRDTASPTSAT